MPYILTWRPRGGVHQAKTLTGYCPTTRRGTPLRSGAPASHGARAYPPHLPPAAPALHAQNELFARLWGAGAGRMTIAGKRIHLSHRQTYTPQPEDQGLEEVPRQYARKPPSSPGAEQSSPSLRPPRSSSTPSPPAVASSRLHVFSRDRHRVAAATTPCRPLSWPTQRSRPATPGIASRPASPPPLDPVARPRPPAVGTALPP